MKINILLCDTFPGLLPDYIPDYPSMFIRLFNSLVDQVSYTIYPAYKNQFPQEPDREAIYLITGSNSGVYEDNGWIKSLLEFIRKAHAARVRLAGICFGHQAIAAALGGKVVRSEKGWGTGIRPSVILSEKALPYFPEGRMTLHYNHHDQVVELPERAELFVTSEFCPNEGFTLGNHIVTFQGHPEYIDEYNRHLIMNHAQTEPYEVRMEALDSILRYENMGVKAAELILDFLDSKQQKRP